MKPFEINPQLELAETLPGSYYCDPQVFAHQRNQLFPNSWQYLPVTSETPNVRPFELLPGFLAEPLLLVSSPEGERCLSNVCTHRGAILVEQPSACKILQCPYHGRSFDLQGRFKGMPAFEGALNFPRPADHLPNLPLERWGPLRFAALNQPPVAFADWIAPVRQRLDFLPWQDFQFSAADSRDYLLAANWMLYCENYLEGLHIPFVHPALNQALDFKAYRCEPLPWGVLQIGIAAEGEACFELPCDHPDAGMRIAAWYFWLFPNLMLNLYPWGMSLNLVEPIHQFESRIRYLTWIWRPELMQQGAGADTDQTEREDHAVVLKVQRGVRSRLYQRGRYSPSMEQGVHRFHQLLTQS